MKIVQINSYKIGSTGKIMLGIAKLAREADMECVCAFPVLKSNRGVAVEENQILIGNYYGRCVSVLAARLTGRNGCFAYGATRKLLKRLDELAPDVLHLHNLHDSYIHLPSLFAYIKKKNIRVVWTLHDCWSFTGHCPHFDMIGCDKWKTECYACPQYKAYPSSYIDNAKVMHAKKKKWFTGVKDMTIVCPSHWLAELVKQSFLGEYPIKVVHNGIDLSIFKPTENTFKQERGLQDKKLVLGVAFGWGERKGLDVFETLAERLGDDYQVVLVGTDESVRSRLSEKIIAIDRTNSQLELAKLYTAADVFVNPTREETLGLVNIEALACGTPVVTFATGGSPETVSKDCGVVVAKEDIDGLYREIKRVCEEQPYSAEACIAQARKFDQNEKLAEYLAFYK